MYVDLDVVPSDELYHYGVEGMKWGVRRYQNKDGSLTSKGKKKQEEYREKYKDRVSKYRAKGDTQEEAEYKAINSLGRERALKALAVLGGVTAVAAGAIVAKNAYKFRVDKVIKAGTKFQRILSTDKPDIDRAFYAAYKKADAKKYYGLYGNQVRNQNIAKSMLDDSVPMAPHKAILNANVDIKVASQKNAQKVFEDLYNNDSEFKKQVDTRAIFIGSLGKTQKSIKGKYETFNRGLVLHDPDNNKVNEKFYNAMREKGYDAVEDINDKKYSGYKAKAATIVFNNANNKKISVDSVEKMSAKDIDKSYKKEMGKLTVETLLKDPALMGTAAAGTTVGVANSDNSRVRAYKEMHPNTKMTDRQIKKMLEKY